MSQITTHVLDTARGVPAEGIQISLQQSDSNDGWETMTSGITNPDGRIANFLSSDIILPAGVYRMFFETKVYFDRLKTEAFYPYVCVVFEIKDQAHYHVPLLLNPFGYSTYRGS